MRTFSALCLSVLVPLSAHAQPSTITVLSSNATKAVVEELGPQFGSHQARFVSRSATPPSSGSAREGRGRCVAILTATDRQLVPLGQLSAATRTAVARAGAAGGACASPRPTSTADALKGRSNASRRVRRQGATAVIIRSLFEKFGLTEANERKTSSCQPGMPAAIEPSSASRKSARS